MTSQFISSTPDDVEAISEKTENSVADHAAVELRPFHLTRGDPDAQRGGGAPVGHGLVGVGGDDRLAALPRFVDPLGRQGARLDLHEVQIGRRVDAGVLDARPARRRPRPAHGRPCRTPRGAGRACRRCRSRAASAAPGAPRSGSRVKMVACGLIKPSVPPDQMMGTRLAIAATFWPVRSAMSNLERERRQRPRVVVDAPVALRLAEDRHDVLRAKRALVQQPRRVADIIRSPHTNLERLSIHVRSSPLLSLLSPGRRRGRRRWVRATAGAMGVEATRSRPAASDAMRPDGAQTRGAAHARRVVVSTPVAPAVALTRRRAETKRAPRTLTRHHHANDAPTDQR